MTTTWRSRVQELRDGGLTLAQIGQRTGLSTSAVSDLANGHSDSPRGDAAVALYKLHLQRCRTRGANPPEAA